MAQRPRILSRIIRVPIPTLLIAAGLILLALEVKHPELPLWADLFYTIGTVIYLNALGAAYDFFLLMEQRTLDKKD